MAGENGFLNGRGDVKHVNFNDVISVICSFGDYVPDSVQVI
jgi:hypothetical protein